MSEVINAEVGGNYEMPPAGNQNATCIGLYVIGTLDETFEGHSKKVKKLMLAFELVDTNHVFKEENGEEPFVMYKDFTHNLSSKANLRKFLNSWAGKKLDDATAKAFNLANLVGGSCLANVVHDKKKKDGSDIALLISVSPLPNGITPKATRMPNKIFNVNKVPFDEATFKTLPGWIQKKIQSSDEYKAISGGATTTAANEANPFANNDANPFANSGGGVVDATAAKKLF